MNLDLRPGETERESRSTGSSPRNVDPDADMKLDEVIVPDEGYQTGVGSRDMHAPASASDSEVSSPPETKDLPLRPPSAGLEKLGRDMVKMQQSIRHLRDLGVEDLIETLPRIVAVGDQSHGKSSLIEAISEIKVPRNEGACTRVCPMEINLAGTARPDAVWTCKISLRQSYTYNPPAKHARGNMNLASSPTKGLNDRSLGHFVPQETRETFFAITHDKNDLESLLDAAQQATLSPSIDPTTFAPENGSRNRLRKEFDVKFSPNVVRLEAEDNHLIKTVEDLVREYTKSESSLILLTQSMTEDPSNSRAGKIVGDMGAENRCIGVLTKPDRCPSSSFQQWEDMLKGESFRMGHGYFVTKQPSQESLRLGISHSAARVEEKDFFESGRWASSLRAFKNQFGTGKLQEALSQKLSLQIKMSLPDINEKVQVKLNTIRTELQQFPDPPGDDLLMRIVRQLEHFRRQVEQSVEGGFPNNEFQKGWNTLAIQFRTAIVNSRPTIIVSERTNPETPRRGITSERGRKRVPVSASPSSQRGGQSRHTIEVSSGDESPCEAKLQKQTPTKKHKIASIPQHPSPKKAKREDNSPFSSTIVLSKRFTLAQVRDKIQEGHQSGIPNQVDPKTIVDLCSRSVSHWREPMTEFLSISCDMLKDMVRHHLEDAFGTWRETRLFNSAQTALNRMINDAFENQVTAAERTFQLEVARPMTFNNEFLDDSKQEALKLIQEKRLEHLAEAHIAAVEARMGKTYEEADRANKKAKVTWEQVGPDPYAREVEVMSTVRGYYKTALNRFVDHLCLSIRTEFFWGCRNNICSQLETAFGLRERDAQQRCAILTAENPEREERRKRLQRDEHNLTQARDELESVMRELA
ncbi:MAG: hypothetical protein M1837_005090 [Sclerophora amabilis]|nr:MAG: hypothetical protein M1837_005090 [Sclerophora amabilis]